MCTDIAAGSGGVYLLTRHREMSGQEPREGAYFHWRDALFHGQGCKQSSELTSADKRLLSLVKHYFWTCLPIPLGLSLLTRTASLFGIENSNSLILGVEQCDIINKSNDNLFTEYQLVLSFLSEQRLRIESRLDDTTERNYFFDVKDIKKVFYPRHVEK